MIARWTLAAVAMAIGGAAFAQPAPDTNYAITYIETGVKSADAARKLIGRHRDQARKAAGIVQYDAFQRIGYPNHFAIVESWDSAKAREDYAAQPEVAAFRAALAPLLSSPYDERPHYALAAGAKNTAAADAIYAVTHVDIIPPKKDEGIAAVKAFADKSRDSSGNLRFDALTQASRTNHMTIVESWRSKRAKDEHDAAAHVKSFRDGLFPMSGSLYDERLYRLVK